MKLYFLKKNYLIASSKRSCNTYLEMKYTYTIQILLSKDVLSFFYSFRSEVFTSQIQSNKKNLTNNAADEDPVDKFDTKVQ